MTLESDAKLWFGKEHEEFVKFTPEHLKVSKLGLRLDSFVQSRKYMSLKFTEGWGGGGGGYVSWQWWFRNLTNFDPSTQKSKKFTPYWAAFDQNI